MRVCRDLTFNSEIEIRVPMPSDAEHLVCPTNLNDDPARGGVQCAA